MRIGISTSVIQRGQTGIAQYVFALLRSLRAYSEKNQFVLFVLEEDVPLFSFAGNMQIVVVPEKYRSPVDNILWHQTALPGLARKHRLDVLHIPSYRRMLWPRPCALVSTIHDLAAFRVARKYDWRRMFYGRVVARILARRQDDIIAISRSTAQDIAKYFQVSPARMTVIHNGLEHSRFFPGDRAEAKARLAASTGIDAPFFLYVARLEHPAKNHVRLVEAFNRFKAQTGLNWKRVLGGSDWHGSEVIHQKIESSPYVSEIRSLGFVLDRDVPNLYRAADVFAYPSLYEGFGMPPVEAMACGCPVICSTRGSLAEVVGQAASIVDPDDPDSIKSAMVRLATDPAAREALRAEGLSRARCFDWDKTAVATFNTYLAAAKKSKTNRLLLSREMPPWMEQAGHPRRQT
jgi:glycosyltransferase involved in cell wall biosynthesis